jgi:hypothetical protein
VLCWPRLLRRPSSRVLKIILMIGERIRFVSHAAANVTSGGAATLM